MGEDLGESGSTQRWACKRVQAPMENSLAVPQKVKQRTTIGSSIPWLWVHSREMKTCSCRKLLNPQILLIWKDPSDRLECCLFFTVERRTCLFAFTLLYCFQFCLADELVHGADSYPSRTSGPISYFMIRICFRIKKSGKWNSIFQPGNTNTQIKRSILPYLTNQ